MAAAQAILSRVPFVRHILHLWCPEVHRTWLLIRLIRQARDGAPPKRRWQRDWRALMMLSRFRLRRAERLLLKQLPDLEPRLLALGLLLVGRDGRTDWDGAEADLEERLATAIESSRPLLHAFFALIALFGTMQLFAGPMLRIVDALSNPVF